MPEKIVLTFLSQCSQCGCKRSLSIPKPNLAGIDVADLVTAYCMLEEVIASGIIAEHYPKEQSKAHERIKLAMRALHASGHIAGEAP